MIEVSNLGKRFGNLEAVKGVSFAINTGDIVGLLGPNGAGKTTIMKILTCYMFPSSGTASLNGYDIFEQSLQIKASVGYLPENAPLYTDLNVLEYLDFIAQSRGLTGNQKKERIDGAISECGLESVVYQGIDTLSKGYRQRTCLAQAILHDPEILILDEPTSGLDPNQIIEIRDLIKRLGREKTVILSTHILQEVEATCRQVLILNEGKIVAKGTTEEIGRELQGDNLLNLTLKARETPTTLETVAGVRKLLVCEPLGQQRYQIRVSVDPQGNPEEKVFDWAVARGYKILGMVPQRLSLEDIFIKLTREDN